MAGPRYTLEKEREKFGAEASDANAKFASALEEVKLREMTILDLQKKIAEGDAKLKQQQSLYEAVRSDRNLYSKLLIESQDEIAEMKRKFKIMNHQIEQLKEEIQAKDQAYVKEVGRNNTKGSFAFCAERMLAAWAHSAWSTRGVTRRKRRSRTSLCASRKSWPPPRLR